jgi:hypothetical protein
MRRKVMSRIPTASWLHLADQVQSANTFSEKVTTAQQRYPDPMATMTALHYEAAAVINRLAVLIDRSASSVLIDKAANVMERWNQDVVEASVLVKP